MRLPRIEEKVGGATSWFEIYPKIIVVELLRVELRLAVENVWIHRSSKVEFRREMFGFDILYVIDIDIIHYSPR